MQKIIFTNQTFQRIDAATLPAATDLQELIKKFVAPAVRREFDDAVVAFKSDLIEATVKAAGLTWADPK